MRKVNDKFNKTVIVSDISDLRETVGGEKERELGEERKENSGEGEEEREESGKADCFLNNS